MEKIRTISGFKIKKRKSGNITIVDMIKWTGLEHKMYSVFIFTNGSTLGYINTDTPIRDGHINFFETMSKEMTALVIKLAEK